MHERTDVGKMTAGLAVGVTQSAQDSGMAKLTPLHREIVAGFPRSAEQDVRVLFATLLSGDVTPYHSHRFPVTVFMLEGAFTLELDERGSVVIEAGQVCRTRRYQHDRKNDGKIPARMALFYVCEPNAPFADPVVRSPRAA